MSQLIYKLIYRHQHKTRSHWAYRPLRLYDRTAEADGNLIAQQGLTVG